MFKKYVLVTILSCLLLFLVSILFIDDEPEYTEEQMLKFIEREEQRIVALEEEENSEEELEFKRKQLEYEERLEAEKIIRLIGPEAFGDY